MTEQQSHTQIVMQVLTGFLSATQDKRWFCPWWLRMASASVSFKLQSTHVIQELTLSHLLLKSKARCFGNGIGLQFIPFLSSKMKK